MGACVSTPQECVGGRSRSSKNKNRRRRRGGLKRRVPSRLSEGSVDKVDRPAASDRSYTNPAFQGLFLSVSPEWSLMEVVKRCTACFFFFYFYVCLFIFFVGFNYGFMCFNGYV